MLKRGFQAEAAEVVAEAEAALAGELLARHARREDVPGWTVVNPLAHAGWERLAALAEAAATASNPRDEVAAFLASETLSTAGSPAGLVALQREYLIPLERRLLGAAATAPLSPSTAMTAVRAQLARARARGRHPTRPPDE